MLEIEKSAEIRANACPNCYLCNSSGERLYEKLQDRIFGASGEWNLNKCTNSECGLVWLDPMPMEEDIGKAYQSYYTHETGNTGINSLGRFLRAINSYVKTIPPRIVGLRAEELQLNNMYLGDLPPGKLLEIGCGSGKFLNQMQLAGWEVEGLDFDSKAVEYARTKYKINVQVGTLVSIGYKDNSFDAITINHVIEHVPRPIEMLEECYRILKPDGYLIAVTPNINSWGHKKFGANWRGLEPPRHLHLFSQNTLVEVAKKASFQKINAKTVVAHTISVFIASLQQSESINNISNIPDITTYLKSFILQYKEHFLHKKNPDCGEFIVLIAQK